MNLRTEATCTGGTGKTPVPGSLPPLRRVEREAPSPTVVGSCIQAEDRQLSRLLLAGFMLFLVPATVARLTGWRWRPWPPGPDGYGTIVSEAREAAGTYVPFAFTGM